MTDTVSLDELANQDQIRALRDDELKNLRAAAAEWQKGLGGVVGVISAVLLIKGPQTVDELTDGAKIAIAILFGLAIVLGIGAIIASLIASNGLPFDYDATKPNSATLLREKLVKRAKTAFYIAAIATVTSATLITAAIGISWFATALPEGPFVRVELTAGGPYCGILEQADGKTIVLNFDDEPHPYAMENVKSFSIVDSCGVATE